MIVLFNILIIGIVLLIAYWWMDQGFFSSMLHLLAVIAAGCLAFAFWEPLAIDVLLSGGVFDSYAMGITLGGLFAIFLVILRATSDSLVRANIILPAGADKTMGAILGLFSGVLTVGFTLTAIGLLQGPHEMMGYKGFGRQRGQPGVIAEAGPQLWMPVDRWSNAFFDWLSVSTIRPDISGAPLMQYNPELYKMGSLLRDNYNAGEGQVSMPADGAEIPRVAKIDGADMWVVQTNFKSSSRDFGRQLVLSSSQVRLVGSARGTKAPDVIYPIGWVQSSVETGLPTTYMFDDPANFASGTPGQNESQMAFFFEAPSGFSPEFIQLRGTRFELPDATSANASDLAFLGGGTSGGVQDDRQLGLPIDDAVDVSKRVANFRPSVNRIPGSMQLTEDNEFDSGFLRLPRRSESQTSRALQVNSIATPGGTQVVQVTVSRSSPAWLGGKVEERVKPEDQIALLDSMGNRYLPVGYYFIFGTELELKLDPQYGVHTTTELPQLSPSQTDQVLVLIFQVTGGVNLTSLRVGHTLVGSMNVEVPPAF
ncbi:MAG: hypothetical protein CMJ41_01955 [Phycisphaerae bacterium]|nr:hypothetical protein [Phycisphaerae bacterium]